jgi:hypothetical protein
MERGRLASLCSTVMIHCELGVPGKNLEAWAGKLGIGVELCKPCSFAASAWVDGSGAHPCSS